MKIVEKEKSHFYWWSNFHNVKWNLRSVKHTVVYFFPLLSPHVFVLIVDKLDDILHVIEEKPINFVLL